MRLDPQGRSENLEDRRGGGGVRRGTMGMGGLLILLVLSFIFKTDLVSLGSGLAGTPEVTPGQAIDDPNEEPMVRRVSAILDSNQVYWSQEMEGYRPAKLVLFRDVVESACGMAQAASGPFYCPGDQKVYIDLSFYQQLQDQFGAPGDMAQAYVLAHEIGHHVQNQVGTAQEVARIQQTNPRLANQVSVALELQADCLAGMWAHHAGRQGVLEEGDIEEGLRAAAAVGDDRIQRMSGHAVSPESFTHGSSEQRLMWFKRGFETGDYKQCDTFKGFNQG